MIPRERERLEAIERILQELVERDPNCAIIVEGDRDVTALRGLEIPGPLEKLNVGSSLLNFCEDMARRYDSFILLTDWDPKGEELAKRLEQYLVTAGTSVDVTLRRRLGRLLPYRIHEVESLDGHVTRMRSMATSGYPDQEGTSVP
jgi:5S rRNA maturation endonuclease (ribonuclease M5)